MQALKYKRLEDMPEADWKKVLLVPGNQNIITPISYGTHNKDVKSTFGELCVVCCYLFVLPPHPCTFPADAANIKNVKANTHLGRTEHPAEQIERGGNLVEILDWAGWGHIQSKSEGLRTYLKGAFKTSVVLQQAGYDDLTKFCYPYEGVADDIPAELFTKVMPKLDDVYDKAKRVYDYAERR